MSDLTDLIHTPLFAVAITLGAYQLGLEVKRRTHGHPLAQPVLVAMVVLVIVLKVLDLDYTTYLAGGSIISFFLGPATVALAVPLYRQLAALKGLVVPLLVSIPLGAIVSVCLGYFLVRLCGGSEQLALTMAPKSATTPVSIAVSEQVGGLPSLTAVFTVLIGLVGAVAAPTLMTWMRIRDRRARGVAMGAVSHGVGTSRSLADNETEGAFSGLSMGLSALMVSIVVPILVAIV
ncbi:LrgB family protein [Nocardioides sp.]|uniref:LrgB family protein n=1 Tax=Nocardioides sp. TaxID=35761 RepID=UPI00262C0A22|nr:LrgB family protein [Nocardioides sp.]